MIDYEQALALCRSDPDTAARLICDLSARVDAQPGHPKHERPLFSEGDIDEVHDYRLNACPECNNPDVTFIDRPPRIIQQMELEKIVVLKEEHRSYPVWCERCGKIHYHPFPDMWSKRDCSRNVSPRWWPT